MLAAHPWVLAAPLAVALVAFVLTRRAAVAVAIVLSAALNALAVRQLAPPAPDGLPAADERSVPLPVLPMPDDPDAPSEFAVEAGPVVGPPDVPDAGGPVPIPSGTPDAKLAAAQPAPLSQPPPDLPAVSAQAALDEIGRRVADASGYQNGPLTFTVIWFNRNDLDIHVKLPNGEWIWYDKLSAGGGVLDVDRNRAGETNKPVENVSWRGKPPAGRYEVYVTFYHPWESNGAAGASRFLARVLIDGKPAVVDGRPITAGDVTYDSPFDHQKPQQLVFKFDYPAR